MLTADILRALAPRTPKAKRDRFLPFLNEACPRYGIVTELRLAAFLATICVESDYFKATEEYGKGRGRSYGKPHKTTRKVYYGRGLIQTTWHDNYEDLNDGLPGEHPDFVNNPDALIEPRWAVESACFFWQHNNLNALADKGKFFAIQGLVNRGDASKLALHYSDRLRLYDIAMRALPDDGDPAQDHPPPAITPPEPAAVAPIAETTLTDPQPGAIDRILQPIENIKARLTAMDLDPMKMSGGSWITTVGTKAGGYALAFMGWIGDNPFYLLAGVALIAAGIWYFSQSRNRLDARRVLLSKKD